MRRILQLLRSGAVALSDTDEESSCDEVISFLLHPTNMRTNTRAYIAAFDESFIRPGLCLKLISRKTGNGLSFYTGYHDGDLYRIPGFSLRSGHEEEQQNRNLFFVLTLKLLEPSLKMPKKIFVLAGSGQRRRK